MRKLIVLLFVCALIVTSCAKKKLPESTSPVLAKIGDRVITEQEFMQRAEYTIRPPYCKQNSYIHKKIILNSLIAEKLVALEADSSELAKNERFQQFIQGRKEQAMRQLFFQQNMYGKVELDRDEQQKIFNQAGREYDVNFISTQDVNFSNALQEQIHQQHKNLVQALGGYTNADSVAVPKRVIKFTPQENWQVLEALYNQDVQKGDVIGPIKIEDENLWVQVNGWTDKVALASQDVQNRWQDVTEHVTYREALKIYNEYVGKLMRNKRVDFDRDTFMALANAIGPVYFPEKDKQKDLLQQNVFGKRMENDGLVDSVSTHLSQLKDKPLLNYNGQVWKVGDLDREMMLHPLQFRKRNFGKSEFGNQLKLAIVDMIKDKEITQQAYKEELDQHPFVVAKTFMWQDAYLAMFARNQILAEQGWQEDFKDNYMHVLEESFNPMIDSLQTKYSDVIEINTDLFEKINVTNIDMFAIYADQPYPIIVPSFPVLTTDPWLDYGKKLAE